MKVKLERKKYVAKTQDILGNYKIASAEDTMEKLINENCSISRYGDGEFKLIFGISIGYQEYDEHLKERLKEVLNSNEENLLVGINNVINMKYLEIYVDFATNFWTKWLAKNKFNLLKILDKNKKYYSSNVTRFYIDYKDKTKSKDYINKMKKIWENKEIVIVEGKESRLGIGNDLFNNAKSIQRIICPSKNAFQKYNKILNQILKVDKSKLIMLALGPTATVLAYDLHKNGYRALDIGHIDIEYEWMLRKATTKIKVEGKYVTEAKDGRDNIDDIYDEKYFSEIIAEID